MFFPNSNQLVNTRNSKQVRAAIYVRVSTREQAEKGYSIQEQIKSCRSYCYQKGWKVVRIYKENGVSGKNLNRPKLQLLFDHAENKQFDVVVFWRSDRLTRTVGDLSYLVDYFEEISIDISCVTEPFDTTTADGRFLINLSGSLAQRERELLIERSKIGIRARARDGKWRGGKTPYGYKYNKVTQKLEIDKKEAPNVKLMFNKYLELGTINDVTRHLNKNNIPTRNAKEWSNTAVGNILSRKIYKGVYSCAEVTKNMPELKIIDKKKYKNVQKQRKQRKIFGPTPFVKKRKRLDEIFVGYLPQITIQ